MKLTDLRQVETSKEEMGFVKGGDEQSCLCCPACSCECDTSTNSDSTKKSARNGSKLGQYIDGAINAVGAAASAI